MMRDSFIFLMFTKHKTWKGVTFRRLTEAWNNLLCNARVNKHLNIALDLSRNGRKKFYYKNIEFNS